MPQPRISSVHIDRAITNMAMRYSNPLFVGQNFAPVIPVEKESDDYFIYDKAEWLRDVADDDRRPGARAPRSGYTLSTAKYALRQAAQAMAVPDRIAENSDDPLRPYEDASAFCMQMVLLRRERRIATKLFTGGNWGTNTTLAGTDQWSDFVNSDPAEDVNTAIDAVLQNTGFRPNTMLVGQQVWSKLRIHPDGLDRYKHTQTGVMTAAMVAEWLGIERLLIGAATRNSAAEGAAFSGSFIWGKHALIAYVTGNPSISEPSGSYIFQKRGVQTKRFREEAEAQDVVETTLSFDIQITGSDLGYFYTNASA